MHRITAHLHRFLQFIMHMFIYILRCILPNKVIESKVFLTYSKDGLLLILQSHNLMQNAWRKYLCLSGNCLCPKSSNQYQSYVTFDAWQIFYLLLTKWKIAFCNKRKLFNASYTGATTFLQNSFEWSEAATGAVLYGKLFLEISQNLQESTCARVSFLIQLHLKLY